MSSRSAKPNRTFFACTCILISFGSIPAYQYGVPWIQFHHENLIVHDCQLQSESIPVGAKYAGRIEQVFVEVGQAVEIGDVIATMDIEELVARRTKAEATIALAQENRKAKCMAIEKELKTISAQYQCMLAKTEVASKRSLAIKQETKWIEKKLLRSRRLAKSGSVSQDELETLLRELQNFKGKATIADEELRVAQLDLEIVNARIQEVTAKSSNLDVLEKTIALAKSELAEIQELQDAATIKAKTAGVVTSIVRGAGSSLKVGDPIVQLQSKKVWGEIWVDETQLSHVVPGTPVEIRLKAMPSVELAGSLVGFLPADETENKMPQPSSNPILRSNSKIRIKIELEQSQTELPPGLTGTAVIKKKHDPMTKLESSIAKR